MPISREEFQDGKIDLSIPILTVLESGKFEAWNAEELYEQLQSRMRNNIGLIEVIGVLGKLVVDGKLEPKEISGKTYYRSTFLPKTGD